MAAFLAQAQTSPAIEYYKLASGFLPESKDANGNPLGPAFAGPNPWGANTVYLMATNSKGQRTWRIENFLSQGSRSQGSTMYLLEGSQRALLVDTAQNTPEEMGKNDLKTLVRHLLGHNNSGAAKSDPVDFVVAISHGHGDHTGKISQMSDRTVYFPGPRLAKQHSARATFQSRREAEPRRTAPARRWERSPWGIGRSG